MTQKYTYSIATNFGGSVYIDALKTEITQSVISPTCYGVNITGDVVDIYFSATLTAGEEIILLNIISAHSALNTPAAAFSTNYSKTLTLVPAITKMNTSTYVVLMSFLFDGYKDVLSEIILNSHKENDTSNYTIQILNFSETLIIAEGTFTNNDPTSLQTLSISNIPTKQNTILQIKGKTDTTDKNAYLNSLVFKLS